MQSDPPGCRIAPRPSPGSSATRHERLSAPVSSVSSMKNEGRPCPPVSRFDMCPQIRLESAHPSRIGCLAAPSPGSMSASPPRPHIWKGTGEAHLLHDDTRTDELVSY